MKTQGKIKSHCREETESVKKLDVPRADMTRARTFGKDEIDVLVQRMIKDINEKYTYKQCLLIVPCSDDIPYSLYKLLKGAGLNGMAVWNLPVLYLDYKHGNYDAYQFIYDVEKLFNELVREFDELVNIFIYGSIEGEENEDEGTESVFSF